MDLIFSLCSQYLSFLSLNDLGRLDTAISCRANREYFITNILKLYFMSMRKRVIEELSNDYVSWLGRRCIALRRLDLSDNVTDEALQLVSNYCYRLDTLDIEFNGILTDVGVTSVLRQARFLRSFSYKFFTGDNDKERLMSVHRNIQCLADSCPNLNSLTTSCYHSLFRGSEISIIKSGIVRVVEQCPQLQQLSLHKCWGFENETVRLLADAFRRLQSSIPTVGATKYDGLISLDLYDFPRMSPEALVDICSSCPKLKSIGISHISAFTDESILGIVSSCKELEIIRFSGEVGVEHPSDSAMQSIFNNCPNLKSIYIDITRGNLFTDMAFVGIYKCPQLRELRVYEGSGEYSNVTLFRIADCLPQLERLSLNGCNKVTRIGIDTLHKHCKNLLSVILYETYKGLCYRMRSVGGRCVIVHPLVDRT